MSENNRNETEYPLTETERDVVDNQDRQISMLLQQKSGMLLLLARLRGLVNLNIDYRDGKLVTTPRA